MMKIGLFVIIIAFRHVAAHCNNPLMWNYEYQHLAKCSGVSVCCVCDYFFIPKSPSIRYAYVYGGNNAAMFSKCRRGRQPKLSYTITQRTKRRNTSVESGMEWRQISNSDVYLSQLRGISSPHLWLVLCVLCGDYRGSLQPPLVSVIVKVRAERQT